VEENRFTDLEDYNPLADDRDTGEDEEVRVIGVVDTPAPEKAEAAQDTRTPRERITALIDAMAPQRKILLGLIDFCREPRSAAEVDGRLEELTRYQYCVYDGVELRRLLQEIEALHYQEPESEQNETAGGLSERSDVEVGADGQEYLVIHQREEGKWLSAAAAVELVEEQDPAADLSRLLEAEPRYRNIYQRVLAYCRTPRTVKELEKLLNDDPLLQDPRRYGGYFIERLEKNSGIEWQGGWVTTALGIAALSPEQT
jgi:hypothetical protein